MGNLICYLIMKYSLAVLALLGYVQAEVIPL